MSDLPLDVKDQFRNYLGDEIGGPVVVYHDNDAGDVEDKIHDVNDAQEITTPESPAGRGRLVQLPAGRLKTGELILRQAQSVRGVKGSTILTLDSEATISDQGGDLGAYITIDDDFRVHDGVAGQGVIQDLDIDVTASQVMNDPEQIHGLYAPQRSAGGNVHTMRNVAVYNAKTNGIHFSAGNDKLVCDRLRSEGALGIGIYLAGGDIKARALGSSAKGSALKIDSAAIELDQFDLWRISSPIAEQPTLDIIGGSNGCVIKSGTVEGNTRFKGKNNSADSHDTGVGGSGGPTSPRFLNSKAQFAFVHFKHSVDQAPDCYFEAESADLVELISCKFGRSGPDPKTDDPDYGLFFKYNYLIKITKSGSSTDNLGLIKISGGGGLVRYLGRVGSSTDMRMVMDCKKHFCNHPELVLFDWGRPGSVEIVPVWAVDSPDASLRTHVRMDGNWRSKEEYPFGYLCATIGNAGGYGTLDDSETQWKAELLPDVSSNYCYAMRVVP